MSENNIHAYGQLCSLFYDATEKYASEQEVNFFASYIDEHPGRVLEAMSGSGRLQIPLMQRGCIVDGVDISPAMLARCRQRCSSLGLEPTLYQESLENLSLPYKYSTVIIAFGSLQLIADHDLVLKALKNLHTHMLACGNLLIDIFVPDITIDDHSVSTVRLDEHRMIRLKRRHIFDEHKKIVNTFSLFELIVDGVVLQQENELIEMVWRCDKQWKELLLKAGFEVIRIYDETFKKSEPSRVIHARAAVKK
ncbi:MAG: class I SAM-dependent methyltransferase [Candidatus Dependentiae bacterium]|nr:class I SAM-dependent methyltransferase [Candidatus Dependentiae bacterium]